LYDIITALDGKRSMSGLPGLWLYDFQGDCSSPPPLQITIKILIILLLLLPPLLLLLLLLLISSSPPPHLSLAIL
jgi:hypothetical protein